MDVDACAAFVQHNCVEFFTQEDHLAEGLHTLSDADLFISGQVKVTLSRSNPKCHSSSLTAMWTIVSPVTRLLACSPTEAASLSMNNTPSH